MPVAYQPKPIKVKNLATFKKLGITLEGLTRSQTHTIDQITTLLKPANKRADYRDDVADVIAELLNYVKGLNAAQCRDTIRSIANQIKRGGEYNQEPKAYRFDIGRDLAELLHQLSKPKH